MQRQANTHIHTHPHTPHPHTHTTHTTQAMYCDSFQALQAARLTGSALPPLARLQLADDSSPPLLPARLALATECTLSSPTPMPPTKQRIVKQAEGLFVLLNKNLTEICCQHLG